MSNTAATLLIVDDETHVRKLLQILLQNQGYQTLTARSGEEALAQVAMKLGQAIYEKQAQADASPAGEPAHEAPAEDVVDAEFSEVDDTKA